MTKKVIKKITDETNKAEMLKAEILQAFELESKPIVLFGGGAIGAHNLWYLRRLKRNCEFYFCDNDPNKRGLEVDGVPVISFSDLINKVPDCYIVVSSTHYFDEILQQLQESKLCEHLLIPAHHFSGEYTGQFTFSVKEYKNVVQENFTKFEAAYEVFSDEFSKKVFIERINHLISSDPKYLTPFTSDAPQYFDPELINLSENEVLVDGGAYDGDTISRFLKYTNGKFSKIFAFEPEKSKCDRIPEKIINDSRIEFHNLGLWDRTETLRFMATDDGASCVSNDGNVEVLVTSIDETVRDTPVTFIKMDIEGAELKALEGAQQTIRKHKPKLAICVYHNDLDLAEIPLYIKKLVPEYKIHLRHYGPGLFETVCYATAD